MQERQPAKKISEPPPLLPLEYCRPERAAKLLNCEIEDLYHWAANGAIKIYVNAAKAVAGVKSVSTTEPELVTSWDRGDTWQGRLKFYAGFDGLPGSPYDSSKYERDYAGFCHFKVAGLHGFWAVAPFHFWRWEQEGGIPDSCEYGLSLFSNFDLRSSKYFIGDDETDVMAEVLASFPSIADNLWLMREDLEKLHRHIHTGQPFPIEQGAVEQAFTTAGGLLPRTTANQCRAIVELLIAHGFTDEDFSGSIEGLQKKIARKGVSETLAKVDNKTLTVWLTKAGKR